MTAVRLRAILTGVPCRPRLPRRAGVRRLGAPGALHLAVAAWLAGCGADGTISPTGPVVLEGDYAIRSREDIARLRKLGGDSFSITGGLLIMRSDLTSLEGLGNLTGIGRSLEIRFNESLTSLNGLDGLTSVGDSLMDTGAPLGESLAPEIQPKASSGKRAHVVEGFIVTDNPLLTTMEGVERLAFVGGGLSLIYNSSLNSLQALNNLTHIRGSVDILANDALASLEGLNQLSGVEGYLEVGVNRSLRDLDGLSNLAEVGSDLVIWFNDSLRNLQGLNKLARIGGQVILDHNPVLSDELVQEFVDRIRAGGFSGEIIIPQRPPPD